MCISATVNFAASACIAAVGIATLSRVSQPRAVLFAAMPLRHLRIARRVDAQGRALVRHPQFRRSRRHPTDGALGLHLDLVPLCRDHQRDPALAVVKCI